MSPPVVDGDVVGLWSTGCVDDGIGPLLSGGGVGLCMGGVGRGGVGMGGVGRGGIGGGPVGLQGIEKSGLPNRFRWASN